MPLLAGIHVFKLNYQHKSLNATLFTSISTMCTDHHIHALYTKCYKKQITDPLIDQVSVVLMVSSDACTQVVQGSNPTDGWKVIRSATAFSAVAFKMILRAPVRVPVLFLHNFFLLLTAFCKMSKY